MFKNPTQFKLSVIAFSVAMSFSSSLYANAEQPPECYTFPIPNEDRTMDPNPRCRVNLTKEIESRYNGQGVTVGVVDAGYILSHPALSTDSIRPLTFSLHNPIANRQDNFDPRIDYTINRDGEVVRAAHGGQIASIIAGKMFPFPNAPFDYEGGIAKKATVYIASTHALDQSGNGGANYARSEDIYVVSGKNGTDYAHARYAAALDKVLEQNPFVVNISSNPDAKAGIDTAEQLDARFKNTLPNFSQDPFMLAVKKTAAQDRLLVFPTGNESRRQPGIYALLPRYVSGLDKHLIAATAIEGKDRLANYANHCGAAKNWCISAPGTFLSLMLKTPDEPFEHSDLEPSQGTSLAAPIVSSSLAILKQRFDYLKPSQIRDTLFTTATDLGDDGVDDVFGWGLVNVERALKGPMQLLDNETFTVTQDDAWENPLNTGNYKFTKSGDRSLELRGINRLADVAVEQGNLALAGDTTANRVQNNAQLTLKTKLNAPIVGTINSRTTLEANGHWVMPESTTVGNVEMAEGSQITLNPRNSKAGSEGSVGNDFNTLTINQNLSGSGIFNYLTRLQDWVGDKVLVNGLASGTFKLDVENRGTEPTTADRLTLMELRHGAQDPNAVNVSLVRPVDFGTYRYELIKTDGNIYRLYNPLKEKEINDAAVEAERQRIAAEEAAKQEQARQLAEAQRLAVERQTALAAETLAKEAALRERDEARRTLATQTEALQSAEALVRSKTALLEQTQASLTAEQEAKTAALQAAEALRTSLAAEQAAKQAAQKAEESANQAKLAADSEKAAALQQAQNALKEAERKAEEARVAAQQAADAERLKQLADSQLANANQQLEEQKAATKLAQAQQQAAEEALTKQTEALQAAQQAREQADNALQAANNDKATALAQAENAQRLAQQKSEAAEQAQQQLAAKNSELNTIQANLEQARQAQAQLEAEKAQLLAQKTATEQQNSELTTENRTLTADLNRIRDNLNATQAALTQKAQEAEQARQAQEQARQAQEQAAAAEAAAVALAAQAEQAKAAALVEAQQAEAAKAAAQEEARLAQAAKIQADNEKNAALTAKAAAELATAQAEQAVRDLTDAQAQSEHRKKEIEEALRSTEQALQAERLARVELEAAKQRLESAQNGTEADLTAARQALEQAHHALATKTEEVAAARLAQQQAENAEAAARLAQATALQAQRQAESDKAAALAAQTLAEQQANRAIVAQAEAEAARLAALQTAQQAEADLASAVAAQQKAEAEKHAAQANAAQAALIKAQTEADHARIAEANQALTQANAALETALAAEKEARQRAEEANAILHSSQNGNAQDLANARLALAEAQRQAAQTEAENTKAQIAAEAARQALLQAEQAKTVAEAQARLAEQEKIAAQQGKQQAEALVQQAQADLARLTAAKDQAEVAQAQAILAATQAQAAQQRAEQATAASERALAAEQLARQRAEQAKAEVEAAHQRSENALHTARQQLTQAEQALAVAEYQREEKQKEAEEAKQLATQSLAAQKQAEHVAALAQQAKQQAEADKAVAEQAQAQAEAEKVAAEQAQAQAEAEKVAAEQAQAQAEADKVAAEQAQAQAEADKVAAEQAQAQAEADKVAAEQAQVQAEADKAGTALTQQAEQLAVQRKQAELISRYSNSAISELSAQVNVLEQISHSLSNHLFDTHRNLSVWAEYNKQHSDQASDNYRRFQQDSELKQVAISVPFGESEQLSLGVIATEVRSFGQFDDNIRYQSTTKMVSGFARLNVEDRFFAEMDIGRGSSDNRLHLNDEKSAFKRQVTSAGVRIGYSADAFGLKVQPSVGLRYHHLGALNYRLAEAEVQSGQLYIAGLQAGIRVEKAWQWGNTTLAPYFATYYSDMSQQQHSLAVNDNMLSQQFGRNYRHEIGLKAQKGTWQLDAKAGSISGNEAMKQRYAGVKLNYQW